jgi:hypothetical protein
VTEAKPRRRLPAHVAEAMAAILEYLWQAEAKDYLSRNREEQEGHIFVEMLNVRNWLNQQQRVRRGSNED